jgi:hypothetical protein
MVRFALTVLLVLWMPPAVAAPEAEPWERWIRHDPASTAQIGHAVWGRFLADYVAIDATGLNRVAYGRVSVADRAALRGYLDLMAAAPVSTLNRPEQLAFWINLYNALTLEVVLAHYPVRSIRDIDISPGLFSHGPWRAKLLSVEGEPLSLDDIEHRILRPVWRDPRIHYAVNCASVGCPNLQREPFEPAGLDRMLDLAAIDFVNHPRGVRVGTDGFHVSSIYIWFENDFGGDEAGVIRHLMAYARPGLAMRLQKLDEIVGHDYDWALNDAAQAGR